MSKQSGTVSEIMGEEDVVVVVLRMFQESDSQSGKKVRILRYTILV